MQAQGGTYILSAPPREASSLFVNVGGGVSSISYRLVFTTVARRVSAGPGGFFVDNAGAVFARPEKNGVYIGHLRAQTLGGEYADVKNWTFEVLQNDTEVDAYGPNNRTCDNNGEKVDLIPFDQVFHCNCTGFQGDNCEVPPQASSARGSDGGDDTLAIILACAFAAFAVGTFAIVAVLRRRAHLQKMRAFDFQAEILRMQEAGELEDSLSAKSNVPREIKRAAVTLVNKIGAGQFGEVSATAQRKSPIADRLHHVSATPAPRHFVVVAHTS